MFGAFFRGNVQRVILATLIVSVGVAGCRSGISKPVGEAAPRAESQTVRFLLVNDVYVTDTLRDGAGGLARVAALRDSIERATNSRVVFVLAGDVLSPSVLSKWYGGSQMVDGFNAARLDYAALGNHEFDASRANLVARINESKFSWLGGNCVEPNGTPFPGVRGWDTVSVSGVKVGVYSTNVITQYPNWVQCRDPDVATAALVDTLEQQKADLVVGITHRFMFEDSTTLWNEPRITAILGGHEHDGHRLEHNGRLIVKAVSNVRTAVLVTFTRTASGWTATDHLFRIERGMREDVATLASVQRWRDTLTRRIGPDRVLGVAVEPINASDSSSRRGESRFGNMIVDAMRAGTGADVALINSGALRFDDIMPAGPITRHMIEGVFLFSDETRAVVFKLTGARLRELLENGVRPEALGRGAYPQVSGVHFSFDARLPSGLRVVGNLTRDDGSVIEPGDELRVAFVTYPACKGGDGYVIPEAREVCAAHDADPTSVPRTVDLVVRHLESMSGTIVMPQTGRVVRLDR